MGCNNLKVDFIRWLKEKAEYDLNYSDEKYKNLGYNISIFSYGEEFKNYLAEEKNADSSICALSISEILSLDIDDGQFVNNKSQNDSCKESSEKEETETDEDIEPEENLKISFDDETSSKDENIDFALEIFNEFLNDETVKKSLDTDLDGSLSAEEIQSCISMLDKDGEVTFDDLVEAFLKIKNGEKIEDEPLEETKEGETEEISESTDSKKTASSVVSSAGISSGSYNPSSVMSSQTNTEGKTLEQLKSEKSAKEMKVKEAQEKINDIYSGKNEKVKEAQDEYDKKKEEYDKALKNDNIPNELTEKQNENLNSIDNVQKEINETKVKINNKNGEITGIKSRIYSDNSQISALEGAISTLENMSFEDNQKKQQEVQTKLANAKKALQEAKEKLEKDNEKLNSLNEELTVLNSALKNKNDELTALMEDKTNIENEIKSLCSKETKEALENLNSAKNHIEEVKNSELKIAQANLENEQKGLDKINSEINKKEQENTEKEYKVYKSVLPEGTFKGYLQGKEDIVCEISEKYGLDPVLVASIIALESGWGTSNLASRNNFMGYRAPGDMGSVNGFGLFSSVEAGLNKTIANLASYANRYAEVHAVDYNNLDAIAAHYCPGGTWAGKIRTIYQQIASKMR